MAEGAVLTGRRVLAIGLGFLAVVLLANGAFVYLALESFPGLHTPDAYRKGLAFNERLDRAEAQAALGWSMHLATEVSPGGARRITLRYTDAQGQPIDGLNARLSLMRPGDPALDRELDLDPSGPGNYAVRLPDLPAGNWRAEIEAVDPAGRTHLVEQSLWLK